MTAGLMDRAGLRQTDRAYSAGRKGAGLCALAWLIFAGLVTLRLLLYLVSARHIVLDV